jgi:hypothetical protein
LFATRTSAVATELNAPIAPEVKPKFVVPATLLLSVVVHVEAFAEVLSSSVNVDADEKHP